MFMLSHFSHVQLFGTLWTVALQAPLYVGFSRQEYWGGLLCSPAGDLPNSGIHPPSAWVSCIAGGFFTHWPPLGSPNRMLAVAISCAVLCLVAQWCLALCDPVDCSPPGSSVRRDSPGHVLLQEIFPTQGSNPGLPRWRQILYCLSH